MKDFQRTALVLLVLSSAMAFRAHADLIRYDVTFDSTAIAPGSGGFMVFDAQEAGDIWPYIVDWGFRVDGFVFDPSNTRPAISGPLIVDDQFRVFRDFTGPITAGPCFGTGLTCSAVDFPFLAFTRDFGAIRVIYPSNVGRVDILSFAVGVTYSDPVRISVPVLPAIWLILPCLLVCLLQAGCGDRMYAQAALALRRRRGRFLRLRFAG